MKRFLIVVALAAAFVSCRKSDAPDPAGPEAEADYTIIFWGMSGTNDFGVAVDLITVAENYVTGRTADNVQIAGLVKTSVNLSDPSAEDFDRTYYFHSGDTEGKTLDLDSVDSNDVLDIYRNAFRILDGVPYADTTYALNNVDSLAAFISRTAEEFPAKNYVLMLLGHGGGFSPAEETPLTRACLYDNYKNGDYLTADAVVSAAEKSGVHIQTLFTQCCLMGTLENIAAYSKAFDYGFLAAEETYSYYFPEYLVKLSAAGSEEQKMQEASRELVDYYVSTLADSPDAYSTHGFYDLRQTSGLLSVVKDIASWYSTNYPALQQKIDDAVCNTIYCNNLKGEETETLRKEREYLQALLNDDEGVLILIGEYTYEEYMMEIFDTMENLAYHSISYGFPLAHLLSTTLSELTSDESAFLSLKSLEQRYKSAIKDMAYIRANPVPEGATGDYEYLYCSPTINIFAMNEKYFTPILGSQETYDAFVVAVKNNDPDTSGKLLEEMFGGSIFANYVSLEQAELNYTSSVFDKAVGWSSFLKKLQTNPSVLYNPDRREIDEMVFAL